LVKTGKYREDYEKKETPLLTIDSLAEMIGKHRTIARA